MSRIYFDTECNAPCVGMIVLASDTSRTVLVQTDWDYPGVAQSFGWSLTELQRNRRTPCQHSGTDGTIDCPDCGIPASEFISAAGDWLQSNDGVSAEDPGYFDVD
jgi:hypothetical protein